MDLNYLKRLIKIFDDSSIDDLTLEEEGIKIKISRNKKTNLQDRYSYYPQLNIQNQQPVIELAQPENKIATSEQVATVQSKEVISNSIDTNLHTLYSPIVGTFYRSPSPDSQPYCEIGSTVKIGQTLCIVEAMKLMNEIESDINGTIIKIFVENASPVEFNQPLFLIKKD